MKIRLKKLNDLVVDKNLEQLEQVRDTLYLNACNVKRTGKVSDNSHLIPSIYHSITGLASKCRRKNRKYAEELVDSCIKDLIYACFRTEGSLELQIYNPDILFEAED